MNLVLTELLNVVFNMYKYFYMMYKFIDSDLLLLDFIQYNRKQQLP